MTGASPASSASSASGASRASGASGTSVLGADPAALWDSVIREVAAGRRFAGLMATQRPDGVLLTAHLADAAGIAAAEALLPPDAGRYPALTPMLGAAFWYEREIHDLFGITPDGHPRLAPLVLPRGIGDHGIDDHGVDDHGVDGHGVDGHGVDGHGVDGHGAGAAPPRPGAPGGPEIIEPDTRQLPRHVMGPGLFTIPHGPVRSGVLESIEYLVETPGEDIPHLNMRVHYKHRGIEKRFEGMAATDGVLLAERTEGVASVAHALAYCHAIERIAGVPVPWAAGLIRVLYAELERAANHLDTAVRLCDAAGLAVATARFGLHKERVARLVSRMCGSRFGRGVVVPGGVTGRPQVSGALLLAETAALERAIDSDAATLMGTASFLDRLRGTGPLSSQRAREHGALGPIGKASGFSDDARRARPYDGYPALGLGDLHEHSGGDALARLRLRWDELRQSFRLLRQAAGELGGAAGELGGAAGELGGAAGYGPLRAACEATGGRAVGWAEAPQGEVLYDVAITGGRITRCHARSASFHNLVLFHEVFAGDILTDFPFIEASFGLSVAGVAR